MQGRVHTGSQCLLILSYMPLESSLCPPQYQKHWLTETHARPLYQANTAGGGEGTLCPQLAHTVPYWESRLINSISALCLCGEASVLGWREFPKE